MHQRVSGFVLIGFLLSATAQAASGPPAPAESRPDLFHPPARPAIPLVRSSEQVSNPVDAFVLARLEAQGLTLSPRADRLRLLRRVTFDLTGLPPTLAEQEAFLADRSPEAWSRVVDRLLASPAFGERQAQHWLDLVRFAESDGFKEDALRPDAWRYRDHVIRAFNSDLPYDRFVRQQLAGDELEPYNPDARIATGFNRLYPDEYNAANLEQRRQEILDELTDTTGLVFLGLTVGCARCHDHKYDPISQKDYFRLQAFFASFRPSDLPAATAEEQRDYEHRLAEWEAATRETRAEIEKLIASRREKARWGALDKFRAEIQEAVRTDPARRTPYQRQISLMAERQMDRAARDSVQKLAPEQKKRYQELQKLLPPRPTPPPRTHAITDIGPEAPPTHRLMGGDWRKPAAQVEPGFPAALGGSRPDCSLPAGTPSTGRRAALARWLTSPDHPLTARVIVNRLWQQHFGQGLVATGSDFGAQGTPPTHPELLDWLAWELIDSGWSLKHVHRLMLTSSVYVQDSTLRPDSAVHRRALARDPADNLLWRARRQRLDGEAIRDAVLAISGSLNRRAVGPSARPALPEGVSRYAWKPDESLADQQRRSIYILVQRNMRFPLFDAFDWPDLHNSCSRRQNTTTASQALQLFNGPLTHEQARVWVAQLRDRFGEESDRIVATAYRAAWGRPANPDEVRLGLDFLKRQTERRRDPHQALVDFCHTLFNTNEFLTID
jgi:hypothetical protein